MNDDGYAMIDHNEDDEVTMIRLKHTLAKVATDGGEEKDERGKSFENHSPSVDSAYHLVLFSLKLFRIKVFLKMSNARAGVFHQS